MITCPWCGTNYAAFEPNCQNCGGPLPFPAGDGSQGLEGAFQKDGLILPPPPPRPIANRYAWRLLSSDGWAVAALVFCLLGGIFTLVGGGLTLAVVTAFVGIPFLGLGILFLGGGAGVGGWRYQEAQKTVDVLRSGEAVEGKISQVVENQNVQVNGRSPWVIHYQFQAAGQACEGKVSTLNPPGDALQPGRRACVLYLPQEPGRNTLYPHP